jgi:hypothetical protein
VSTPRESVDCSGCPDCPSWTPYGFCTPAEAERRRLGEEAGAEVCVCGHPRRDHFPDSCAHSTRRYAPAPFRVECQCKGWVAPQRPLTATESHQNHTAGGTTAEKPGEDA